MNSSDIRNLIKQILVDQKLLNKKPSKEDTWTKEDASAWKDLANRVEGLSFYESKIPSLETIPENALAKLKDLLSKKQPKDKVTKEKKIKDTIVQDTENKTKND